MPRKTTMLLLILPPVPRLLDSTKSVRAQALTLLSAVLETRGCLQPAALATAKTAALRAWFPEVCLLMRPPPGSGLSDDTSCQVRRKAGGPGGAEGEGWRSRGAGGPH